MCLITFSYKQHTFYNFVLVANRDEFFNRPTKSLHNWSDHTSLFAGRDLSRGGTWLGLSSQGRFSAVTNYRSGIFADVDKKSRGQLCSDFLVSRQSGSTYMQSIQAHADSYGGFNLLTADASGMHYLSNTGGGYQRLGKGLYGLSNAHLDTDWPKVRKAREALEIALDEPIIDKRMLCRILQDTGQEQDDQLPSTGVSLDWERLLSSRFIQASDYGTRCTTVILQTYDGQTLIFEQSFDQKGKTGEKSIELKLPVFGCE